MDIAQLPVTARMDIETLGDAGAFGRLVLALIEIAVEQAADARDVPDMIDGACDVVSEHVAEARRIATRMREGRG